VDDNGNIRPLDFISDLSINCRLDDDPYLGSIHIGQELITGIIMNAGKPILAFTALKSNWRHGKPIFLDSLETGYGGWISPGRLNIFDTRTVMTSGFAGL